MPIISICEICEQPDIYHYPSTDHYYVTDHEYVDTPKNI